MAEELVRRTLYPKLRDREVLRNLAEVRISEHLSWPDLAAYYQETYGEEVNFTTIKRALMNNPSVWLVPDKVNKAVKAHIEQIWDSVDMLQLMTVAFHSKFAEWYQYYERVVQSWLEEADLPDSERGLRKVRGPFTDEDRKRMDKLWDDIISFFFRMTALMRDLKAPESGPSTLEVLLARISGQVSDTIQGAQPDVKPVPGGLTMDAISLVFRQMSDQTKEMLEGIHSRHQASGRGFYRQLPGEVDVEAEEE